MPKHAQALEATRGQVKQAGAGPKPGSKWHCWVIRTETWWDGSVVSPGESLRDRLDHVGLREARASPFASLLVSQGELHGVD